MSSRKTRKLIILSVIFFLFACSTNSDISIESQKKIPQSVAVVFTEELQKLEQLFPGSIPLVRLGVTDREYYLIGDQLTAKLYDNLLSIYEKVSQEYEIPSAEEYDIVIKFSLQKEKTGWMDLLPSSRIEFQDEDSEKRIKSTSIDITTVVEVFDGMNLILKKKNEITGKGIYRHQRGREFHREVGISSPTTEGLELNRKKFEKAIKDAIQQVNKKVIKFLLKLNGYK